MQQYIYIFLHFTSKIAISTHRDYSDFRPPKARRHHTLRSFTFAFLSAKSWRALTRVFLERRGLIAIDELVIFFDPSIPTSALSYGEEATAASTVSVESLFFFTFSPFLLFESWSAHHSVHVEGHATRCLEDTSVHLVSFFFFVLFLIFCTRPPFVSCSPLFHLFLHFKERHESSWKIYILQTLLVRISPDICLIFFILTLWYFYLTLWYFLKKYSQELATGASITNQSLPFLLGKHLICLSYRKRFYILDLCFYIYKSLLK